MPASLADLAQLSARLGVATFDAQAPDGLRAQSLLDAASALVRAVTGYTWLDPDSSGEDLLAVPGLVSSTVVEVAARAYQNPSGAAQASVGDVSISYGAGGAGAAIYLTRGERTDLLRLVGKSTLISVALRSDTLPGGSSDLLAPTEGDPLPLGPAPWDEP